MARWTIRWFLSLQITLYLLLLFVRGNEDADEAFKNGRNLVLEYFLPMNEGLVVDMGPRREKRDVEGSGEDNGAFSELNEKSIDDVENSTQKMLLEDKQNDTVGILTSVEGSGEVDDFNESSSLEDKSKAVPLIADSEILTTTELDETTENRSELSEENTEMIFDKSEDFDEIRTEETTTAVTEPSSVILDTTTVGDNQEVTITPAEGTTMGLPENNQEEHTTRVYVDTTLSVAASEHTTESPAETTTITPGLVFVGGEEEKIPAVTETGGNVEETKESTVPPIEATTEAIGATHAEDVTEDHAKTVIDFSSTKDSTDIPRVSPKFLPSIPTSTEHSENPPTEQFVEEIFKETHIHKKLEATPGKILQKENLSLAADPLLITNTRLMDSEETVQLSSSEPKRLGAYIIIGLILLSFSSLVGYITFRKRMNRKRQEFESHQESNDTEKALLSLSDYKDSSELEENHLKNNEITPIVVKSNSQMNKFEKNTNFSSPKNLNTTANEKNIEKDNVLKSTAENLTQVIIEGSPKDLEEEKNTPNMEKLIVKTRIDQDSIPKKAIIINRSSTGYMPIPQDNV